MKDPSPVSSPGLSDLAPRSRGRLSPTQPLGPRRFGEGRRHFNHGEPNFKCRSAFGAVVAGDLSLVVLDYAVGGAESETGPFADRLGGVERIEDAFGIAQAGAGVGELDDHFVAFAPERDLETPAADFL